MMRLSKRREPAALVAVVHPLLRGCALVSSRSEPGRWHVIQAEGTCDCTAFKFRGDCSHVRALSEYWAKEANRGD